MKQLISFAIGASLYAGHVYSDASRGYSAISDAGLLELEGQYDKELIKLDKQLRAEFNRAGPGSSVLAVATRNREHTEVMREGVHEERSRRGRLKAALGLAGLTWALVVAIGVGRILPVPEDHSRARMKQLSDPSPIPRPPPGPQVMTPAQAAELLEVPFNAPRPVIEAALQTQLAARDLSRLTGLDPESQNYVLQQCEELKKASHLLLSQQGPAFKTDAPRS